MVESTVVTNELVRSRLRYWVIMALFAEMYFIVGKLSLELASVHPSASPVWPPAGIALGALLVLGRNYWPAVFVGAFFVNVTTEGSVLASLAIATGNTLEAIVAYYLTRSVAGGAKAFERVQGVLAFTLVTVLLAPIVSATFGVSSLVVEGFLLRSQIPSVWFTWWLGDAVGLLIVTPLVVLWAKSPHRQCGARKAGEALIVLLFIVACAAVVFHNPALPLAYVCILPILWTALRFSPRDTALCVVLTSALALVGTLQGLGIFALEGLNQSLLLLQAFLAMCAFTGLIVSSTVLERRLAMRSLEDAVAERTRELQEALDQDRANAERLAHIVNHMTVATVAVDERLKVLYMNDHFRTLFGARRNGDTLSDVFADIRSAFRDPHGTVDGLLEMLAARRRTVDLRLTLKNDETVLCDYIPLTVDGRHRGHLFICREGGDVFATV